MISIIIPTYNEEKYIGATLERLTKDLTLEHEIIITDDKSTDQTISIAKKFPVTVLVPEEKHISIAANRNDGAQEAKGEFLVFIDSSVLIESPDIFFTKALARFEKNPDLVALTVKLGVWKETETVTDRMVYAIFNSLHALKNNILGIGEASGKFQMIRKSAFEKVGGFEPTLITREDADLFQRLARIGKTAYDGTLEVRHSGRRAHAIGWYRLGFIWMRESMNFFFFKKSNLKEWKAIR